MSVSSEAKSLLKFYTSHRFAKNVCKTTGYWIPILSECCQGVQELVFKSKIKILNTIKTLRLSLSVTENQNCFLGLSGNKGLIPEIKQLIQCFMMSGTNFLPVLPTSLPFLNGQPFSAILWWVPFGSVIATKYRISKKHYNSNSNDSEHWNIIKS